ncbi:MAG: amidohydrolase family protein [Methanosarcinales archaeon]|nr:amidohydrolase family protein [Methanosarcinales archaeon]
MIIDFHTHLYPESVAAKVFPAARKKLKVEVAGTGSPSDLGQRMRSAGVDRAVVLPLAKGTRDVSSVNRWTLSVLEEGMIPFGAVHPFMEDLEEELDRLQAQGCRGVKMMPLLQEVFPDDPRSARLYEGLIERKMLLVTHAGKDPLEREEVYGTPEHFARMVECYPELRVVLAHLGGLRMWDEVQRHLLPAAREVYFDTAYVSHYLSRGEMIDLIEEIGADRVLFGTDYPWEDPGTGLQILRSLELPKIDLLLYGNAARLLSL